MLGQLIAGAQGVLGIGQTIAGLVKKKPEIPEYDIPQETYENMTDAEYWSFQGLPEAQKQQFIEQSQRAGATALSRSAERKGGLGLVASAAQQEQDAATQLLSMDATQRMQNLQNLYRARDAMANEKKIQYQSRLDKALQERQEVDNLRGAGLQNLMGAGSTAAGIDAYSDEGGFLSQMLAKRRAKKSEFARKTAPAPVNPKNLSTGIFDKGTYDKLPF